MTVRVRVKDNTKKVVKKIKKKQILGMEAVVKYLDRKVRIELNKPYSTRVSGDDKKKRVGYVGFDKAGHYRKKRYQKKSILVRVLFTKKNLKGMNSAFRRKARKVK